MTNNYYAQCSGLSKTRAPEPIKLFDVDMVFIGPIARRVSIVTTLLLLLTQSYAVTGGPELPNPGKAPLTRDQQIQLGLQASAQIYKQMPVLPDNSPETQYVRQLGEKLAAVIPAQYSWPFQFHVIPQKDINAFALPGGQMFVNVGTILAASNEAELAGVMAHEMAHVYMQHGAKQAGKAQTTSLIAGLAGAVLGAATGGMLGQLAQAGIQFTATGIILKYSRADEAQADAVGAIILWKAGYNPQALADFFKKLEAQGGSGPQFLNSHPDPGNREQAIKREIANWPSKPYQTNSPAFQRARQDAANIKLYTGEEISAGAKTGQWAKLNKQNGATFIPPAGFAVPANTSAGSGSTRPVSLQSVAPSSRMWTTAVGPVSISCPNNWEVRTPSDSYQDVQIGPKAGVTANGIGYGVVFNQVKQSGNIDQVTSALVRLLQRSGGDLQQVGKAQPITVAGVEGRSVDMQSTSPFPDANGQPQKERDWLVTIPRSDGSVVYFIFIAPDSQFDRFKPTYDAMLNSIKFQS